MPATFCKSCIYWERIFSSPLNNFGICREAAVLMKVAADGEKALGSAGTLWTCGYFGCIYFRKTGLEVISLPGIKNGIK